jgi:hypothetical protein
MQEDTISIATPKVVIQDYSSMVPAEIEFPIRHSTHVENILSVNLKLLEQYHLLLQPPANLGCPQLAYLPALQNSPILSQA